MQSQASNLERITALTSLMAKYFRDIPVFQAVGTRTTHQSDSERLVAGNHESFPVNQFKGPPFDDWLNAPLMQVGCNEQPSGATPS